MKPMKESIQLMSNDNGIKAEEDELCYSKVEKLRQTMEYYNVLYRKLEDNIKKEKKLDYDNDDLSDEDYFFEKEIIKGDKEWLKEEMAICEQKKIEIYEEIPEEERIELRFFRKHDARKE